MNLVNYDPVRFLERFHEDVNRLLGGWQGRDDGSSVATSSWVPAVDIREQSDRFLITADVPGVDPADIEVTMEGGTLALRGERKLETQSEESGYRRVERAHGVFYRRFALPDTADGERISARGENGVLEIVIPKREAAKPRRIAIAA